MPRGKTIQRDGKQRRPKQPKTSKMEVLPDDVAMLCRASIRIGIPLEFRVPTMPRVRQAAMSDTTPDFELSIAGEVVGMVSGIAMRKYLMPPNSPMGRTVGRSVTNLFRSLRDRLKAERAGGDEK